MSLFHADTVIIFGRSQHVFFLTPPERVLSLNPYNLVSKNVHRTESYIETARPKRDDYYIIRSGHTPRFWFKKWWKKLKFSKLSLFKNQSRNAPLAPSRRRFWSGNYNRTRAECRWTIFLKIIEWQRSITHLTRVGNYAGSSEQFGLQNFGCLAGLNIPKRQKNKFQRRQIRNQKRLKIFC